MTMPVRVVANDIGVSMRGAPIENEEIKAPPRTSTIDTEDPTTGAMDDRLKSLEDRMTGVEKSMSGLASAVEGLKHSQNMMLGVLGLAFTVGVFGGGYLLTRVDALGDAVSALPQQINSNLIEMNKALSESITAARELPAPQPNVIVVPGNWATSGFQSPPGKAPEAQNPPQ